MKRESTDVRQEQIKKAVLEIISEEGLHNLSTRKLAKRIGLSEGAIFRHFTSKREIILSIIDDVRIDLISQLRSIVQSNEETESKLFTYLCRNIEYLKKYKGITMLLFSEATHLGDKELKAKLNKLLNDQKKMVAEIVLEGIKKGIWDDKVNPDDFADIYLGIPIVFNFELLLKSGRLNTKNFCPKMYSIILKILRK